MVRRLRDYVDAFMELKPYTEPVIEKIKDEPSDYVESNFMKTQNLSAVISSFN